MQNETTNKNQRNTSRRDAEAQSKKTQTKQPIQQGS
jgi:hypothetical protein